MKLDQNNRSRSRPTGARREPNSQTHNYESNGPDVKIRGTARHIAEKYLQLARDAHTGGNAVAAENYLQHAEHYFRLIAATQAGPGSPEEIRREDQEGDDIFRGLPDRFALPEESARRPVAVQGGPYPRQVD